MQTEARVGVVVEGGQRALNSGHGGVAVDGTARKLAQQQKSLHQQSQIGTIPQLLAGGIAGALSKTCTAPLARLTILFQVQGMHSDVATLTKASIWQEASRIIGEEGFRAFWKGNLVTIAHRLPYSSVSFYAYERYKNILHLVPGLESHKRNTSADLGVHFVAGGLAGLTAASATYPLDLVRTRLAAQDAFLNCLLKSSVLQMTKVIYYRGIGHTLQTIVREEGIWGLYKGLGATLLGVGPSIAINFSVYETLRSSWHSQRPNDSTVLVSLTCGSLSGIASSTVGLFSTSTAIENAVKQQVALHSGEPTLLSRLSKVRGVLFDSNILSSHLSATEISKKRFNSEANPQMKVKVYPHNQVLFLATFPLDLVRRRMQLEGAGGRARVYTTGLFGTFRHIIRTEGLRGLYRGILPEYYKVVPGVGICFMTYETLKNAFHQLSMPLTAAIIYTRLHPKGWIWSKFVAIFVLVLVSLEPAAFGRGGVLEIGNFQILSSPASNHSFEHIPAL
ncbi:Mitochondrial substrate carrier family protein B [Vitis vinifera]|uniref:Mitochondrial substrate carrier family protein B n=1 Tax=Vitis vinifera TaxID=29760 RepID=A0A438ENW2_VITVI|nr:Mitochondrial substrate carrier family protein B [Vitis vinifera]